MSAEEWRAIPSAPSYQVSDKGVVRSLCFGEPRSLSMRLTSRGRPEVSIREPRHRRVLVHVLVAEAFLGPRPPGMEVRHLDGDRTNNTPANLQYGTRGENELDKVLHGQHNNASKTHCKRGHEFTPQNTRVVSEPGRRPYRACRACARLHASGALKSA